MDFEKTLQFCICKTRGEGAMHVIYKKITTFKILSTSVPSFALQN